MKKKIRRFIAAALALAICAAGVHYGVSSVSDGSDKTVEVCPVQNVNSYYGPSYSDTMEGTIISKDTQTVDLDTEHELKAVYVKEGDTVKKGDKLLEYDMEADELSAEREDLNRRIQELELETLRNDLELLKRGIVPEDMDTDTSVDSDDYDDSDYDDSDDADTDDEDSDYTGAGDITTQQEDGTQSDPAESSVTDDGQTADDASDEETVLSDDTGDSGSDAEPDDGTLIVEDDSGESDSGTSGDGITSDADEDYTIYEDDTSGLIADETEESGSAYDAALIEDVYSFMASVNAITNTANSSLANLGTQEELSLISSAMLTFQTRFADTVESQRTNLLGENVTVNVCTVKDDVTAFLGENITKQLQEAWDRLTAYQFVAAMQILNPTGEASETLGTSYALANEELIRSAADALLSLPDNVYNDQTMQFTESYSALNSSWTSAGENRVQFLVSLTELLNSSTIVVQSTEQGDEDVISTEGMDGDYDDGGYDDGDYDDGSDAVDFAQLIKDKEREIKEKELDIRETTLTLKEYEQKLSSKIIYAQMDGIVMEAGTMEAQTSDGAFITITGRAGLYVRGSLKESDLGNVEVGDTVSGTTYEGQDFTAEIVEISPYPDTGSSDYFYYYDTSDNESTYPFLAFIEDADGLEVDTGVDMSLEGGSSMYDTSAALSLEEYFIRKDPDGRSYCYVRGEDTLLEKRYLQLGNTEWGTVEIESGLTPSDYIAFPYGDNVEEGAKTTIVDTLSALESDY